MRRLVAVSVAGLLFLAACGSSSSNNGSSGTGGSGTTVAGGDNAFSQLVSNASKANVKITYTDSDGKPITIAQDGNGKTLFESDGSLIISNGSSTVSCDGTTSSAKCTQLPSSTGGVGGSIITGFLSLYNGFARLNSSVYGGHVSDDTIAGQSAKCVTFKASDYAGLAAVAGSKDYDPNAQATFCVDSQSGFLLKLASQSNGNDKNIFVATDYGSASDSDFNPPSTPETIPSIPQITLPGGGTIPQITIPAG